VAIALCLAHAVAVRIAVLFGPTLHSWMMNSFRPLAPAINWAYQLPTLAWFVWLIALWSLVDAGKRLWVPVVLVAGLICIGTQGIGYALLLALQLLDHGNLGN
jgi:hypothetical protein